MASRPQITDGTTTHKFVAMTGLPQPLGPRVRALDRPGVDGIAFKKGGKTNRPRQIETFVDLASESDVKSTIENYRAFIGSVVTLTDGLLVDWSDVVIRDVEAIEGRKVIAGAGGLQSGSAGAILRARWEIQLGSLP